MAGKRYWILAGAVAAILLVPLIGMQVSEGWDWGVFDFIFAFIVLFGAGLTFDLMARKANNLAYKAGVAVAVVAALLLIWVNAAVGIIGDDEVVNLLYLSVPVVGMIGAFISHFEPQGMARASLAMAITQMVIPVIVFAIPSLRALFMEPPGMIGVIALNTIFAILFGGAALLFQKAAWEQPSAGAGQAG